MEFILSLVSGGLTGIIGSIVSRLFDFLHAREVRAQQKDQFAHDEKMLEINGQLADKEWANRLEVQRTENQGKVDVADAEAFTASLNSEPKLYSDGVAKGAFAGGMLVFLDFCRGFTRIVITGWLCAITTLVYFQTRELLGDGIVLTSVDAVNILRLIIDTILYLTTTCILWWFGTRNKQQVPGKVK